MTGPAYTDAERDHRIHTLETVVAVLIVAVSLALGLATIALLLATDGAP